MALMNTGANIVDRIATALHLSPKRVPEFSGTKDNKEEAAGQHEQDYGIIRVAVHKDILREAANRTVELTIPADCLEAVRRDAGFEKDTSGLATGSQRER